VGIQASGDRFLGVPRILFPVLITADELGLPEGEFPPQTFTDGGVYDNLGVRVFDLLGDVDPPLDLILVSDVGKSFRVVRPKPPNEKKFARTRPARLY
jgi:hypothetical protein